MTLTEAREWLTGKRNIYGKLDAQTGTATFQIDHERFKHEAEKTQRAYWIVRAHHEFAEELEGE